MHLAPRPRRLLVVALISLSGLFGVYAAVSISYSSGQASGERKPATPRVAPGGRLDAAKYWDDSFGDGFPDSVRLERPDDRANFARWATFLAESVYYRPPRMALEEVQDCAGLIRFAFRNALMAHTPAWRQSLGLPDDPDSLTSGNSLTRTGR